jgi:hypothetical protein
MKNGIKGELVVNTIIYNKPMPGVIGLTDLEVAEIATYIHNSWGNTHELIDVSATSRILSSCKP